MSRTERLDKLRRVRQKTLDQAVADLARVRRAYDEEQRKLLYLQQVQIEYRQQSPVLSNAPMSASSLQRRVRFVDQIGVAIDEQGRRCGQLCDEIERRQVLASSRKRAVETIAQLIERQRRLAASKQLRTEQKLLDDFVSSRNQTIEGETP